MNNDETVVLECDLALVAATRAYLQTDILGRQALENQLEAAQAKWATARYRLLFPGTISTQQDIAQAKKLRGKIEKAAKNQVIALALVDIAKLLAKFAY